jgi:HCOMODA/2-hydroxy-3-carboxy-muconic semialdehyde decarboxylase
MTGDDSDRAELVAANAILFAQNVLDGFGHVSVRSGSERFLLSRNLAPGLVAEPDLQEFDLAAGTADARPVFLERFIHSELYRARPDVGAVVHSHAPSVVPFSVTETPLVPVWHMASFLADAVPVFDIADHESGSNMLVDSPELGAELAVVLGAGSVALMRGHGMVVVAPTLRQAVFRAVYTMLNAGIQSEALRLGPVRRLSPEECQAATAVNSRQVDRAFELWRRSALAGPMDRQSGQQLPAATPRGAVVVPR